MSTTASKGQGSRGLAGMLRAMAALPGKISPSLPQLLLRVAVAIPFFKSGLTKWDGFLQLSSSAVYLFREEFRLHVLGAAYAWPMPKLVAFLAGSAEIVLPVLLVLGLGTRIAAFGLLVMTGVIQLTVPDGWQNFHLPWAAMLFAILVHGPGRVSLDGVFAGPSRIGAGLRD